MKEAIDTGAIHLPNQKNLEKNFIKKYGDLDGLGSAPAMRKKYGYFNPDDHYETLIETILKPGNSWLDIGCGRRLFPSNPTLSKELAERVGLLVGVDPDPTLDENPYVHEKHRVMMDAFRTGHFFDLVTMRMVAEHVADPEALMSSIDQCTRQDSRVVVYTINRRSPVPLITNLVPFNLHYPAKKILWGSKSKDTFPTSYKMNTYGDLNELFAKRGFDLELFAYLDDCRTFAQYSVGQWVELNILRMFKKLGVRYPENCLLGVFKKS